MKPMRILLIMGLLAASGILCLLVACYPRQAQGWYNSVFQNSQENVQTNFLNNADFEQGFDPLTSSPNTPGEAVGSVGDSWTDNSAQWADVKLRYLEDQTKPHGGQSCQQIDVQDIGDSVPNSACQFVQVIPLAKGTYHASVWLRASEETPVTILLRPNQGAAISQEATINSQWKQVTLTGDLSLPSLTFFIIETTQPNETLWVDDASVERVPERNKLLIALGASLILMATVTAIYYRKSKQTLRPVNLSDSGPIASD